MKSKLLLLWIPIVILNACSSPSTQEEKETTEYKYEYETNSEDPLNTLVYTLDNGLKVIMSVNKEEPRLQTEIAVKTGSKQDPSDATGLAHYLEHMLFKGTSKVATVNWEKEKVLLQQISDLYELNRNTTDSLERIKIYHQIDSVSGLAAKYAIPNEYDKMISSMGAKGTNAYTSLEQTVYINDIPSNELEKWLKIESERFSELVLRLFHTELEAVYEEFNRGLDSDYSLAYETMNAALFKKHTYGTQTTIGKGEHLKNPSMEKIHEYFNTYYVPNNMAIVLAGDIDPDKTVDLVKQYFGGYERKEVPAFTFDPEDEITKPEIIDIYGEDAEWLNIGYRLPGVDTEDRAAIEVMDGVLANGQAGLIDINLVQEQKVLDAYGYSSFSKDYGSYELYGGIREGQSLEECKNLLLEQMEKIKKGDFDDELIPAVIKNAKLDQEQYFEYNQYRTSMMTDYFILDRSLEDQVSDMHKFENVTKQDVIDVANKYFGNNYIVVNKHKGERVTEKVAKPSITSVQLNRDTLSEFAKEIDAFESSRLDPVYVDFDKEIVKGELANGIPTFHIANKTNGVFELRYVLEMGSYSDKELALAVNYLRYLGTDEYSPGELEMEFFKLGLSFGVNASAERVYITLSGIDESFEAGIELFEHILANVKADQEAYNDLVGGILKSRADGKMKKRRILRYAMADYAKYGEDSPIKHVLSEDELNAVDINNLIDKIKGLTSYEHFVSYYGTRSNEDVISMLDKYHKTPAELKPLIPAKKFEELETTANKVYFVDYNMVQTEILFLSRVKPFDKSLGAKAQVFNEYFGGGLSSIVFQELRESKALAYSAYSNFSMPSKMDRSHYVQAYIGAQVDKLEDAANGMLELLNDMPAVKDQYEDSKLASLKKIETTRMKRRWMIWSYLRLKDLGLDYDLTKDYYPQIEKLSLDDLESFFTEYIKGRNYTFCVIGSREKMNIDFLKSLGEYKELTLEEIFGY